MGLSEMWSIEKLKNEAKYLILPEKQFNSPQVFGFSGNFFFSGTDNDQKVNLSTIYNHDAVYTCSLRRKY